MFRVVEVFGVRGGCEYLLYSRIRITKTHNTIKRIRKDTKGPSVSCFRNIFPADIIKPKLCLKEFEKNDSNKY